MSEIGPQRQVKFNPNKVRFDVNHVKFNFTGSMENSFGKWLAEKRLEKGLNQTELAKRSRITKATISLYESDKIAQPRFYQLEKIAKALGLSIDEMHHAYASYRLSAPDLNGERAPRDLAEFLEALKKLVPDQFNFAIDKEKLKNFTPQEYQELLERIKADIEITLRRHTV